MDNPTDDLPSSDSDACDLGGCSEPWAMEMRADNGPRPLRLCERHAEAHAIAVIDAVLSEVA